MTDDQETTNIVWRLPKSQKGRYVRACREEGLPLIEWLQRAADAAADATEARKAARIDLRQEGEPQDRGEHRNAGGIVGGPGQGKG
ncbi:MAG: hypothetical protein JWO82_627 [Akkermansiaceae bacterium]|nr:hypothetical protein [Akkermansiaceae bacterium]